MLEHQSEGIYDTLLIVTTAWLNEDRSISKVSMLKDSIIVVEFEPVDFLPTRYASQLESLVVKICGKLSSSPVIFEIELSAEQLIAWIKLVNVCLGVEF